MAYETDLLEFSDIFEVYIGRRTAIMTQAIFFLNLLSQNLAAIVQGRALNQTHLEVLQAREGLDAGRELADVADAHAREDERAALERRPRARPISLLNLFWPGFAFHIRHTPHRPWDTGSCPLGLLIQKAPYP